MLPPERCTWSIWATTPVLNSSSGVTLSRFSRWETAKMSRSDDETAAWMARSVPGRPAPIGELTPGKITASRSGSTGSVRVSDIPLPPSLGVPAGPHSVMSWQTPPVYR